MKEQTNAEYLREARKRMKMSKRQVGAMMARICEMQSGILPMWRLSADGHQAALQRMEKQSQFCTWEDSRLIAEILQIGEEGANRILATRDVREAINHARHISVQSLGGRVAVGIRRRDDPRSCAFIVTRREELGIVYERHRREAKTHDTPALTMADLRAKDWCLCYIAADAPLYTTWRANLIGKTPKDGYCLVCARWRGHVLDLEGEEQQCN